MKTAFSPTISEFNGMRITINPKEPEHRGRAHMHVGPPSNPRQSVVTIPELELLAGSPLKGPQVRDLRSWMGMGFPEQQPNGVWANVQVSDKLMEDWMTLMNAQMPIKPTTSQSIRNLIPTPQEIKNLKAPKKAKKVSFWGRAQIVKVAVVKDKPFHLDAEFADGARKRVNIAAMYKNPNSNPIHPFYRRHVASQEFFNQVQFDKYAVWWGDAGEESEIEHTDLYSAGTPVKQ